jgi:hypothetical protein
MAEIDARTQTQVASAAPRVAVEPPRQGEPCESCGAPLAADQRYCLNCGHRRGGPRVDYRHYMVAGGGEALPPPPQQPTAEPGPAAEPPKKERDYAPLAAVGGIAILGLMLLVGVLIGKGNSNDTAATPPKIVVPATGTTTATAPEEAGGGGTSAKKKTKGAGSGGGEKKVKGGLTENANSGATVEASKGELEGLEAESGGSYEEKSKKLPNKIATPGKPPPIDTSKPPGGGEGGAEVIK